MPQTVKERGHVSGRGMQRALYKQASLWQGSRLHHFVGRWYNRGGSSTTQLITMLHMVWGLTRYGVPWTVYSRNGPQNGSYHKNTFNSWNGLKRTSGVMQKYMDESLSNLIL